MTRSSNLDLRPSFNLRSGLLYRRLGGPNLGGKLPHQ